MPKQRGFYADRDRSQTGLREIHGDIDTPPCMDDFTGGVTIGLDLNDGSHFGASTGAVRERYRREGPCQLEIMSISR